MATSVVGDTEQQSDETFEFFCSPCKRKNRNTEAEKYCADCNDYYCSGCVKCHEEIPALSGHKIIDKNQAEAKSLPMAPTERCARHRFKTIDMYCQSHDCVGCHTCMTTDHRACDDIFDITEYVKNNQKSEDIEYMRTNLQKMEASLKENIDACNREIERLLKNKKDAMLSLHEFRKEIDKNLDELEQKSIAAIEERFQTIIGKIEEEKRLLQNSQEEVKSAVNNFSSSGSNVAQLFVSCKKGKRSIELGTRCSEEASTRKKKHKFQFKADTELLTNLKEMNNLGVITLMPELLVAGNKQQYSIRHTSDTEACDISSACILEDGSIVLADRGNKKLKRLDRNYTIIDVCDLQFEPRQICLVDKDTVAGIEPGGKAIVFIAVGTEMVKARVITTDHPCYGIAAADGNVYVTNDYTSVIVYNMFGTKLKEFSIDQTGQSLFKSLFGMAVCDNDKKIYVFDETYGLVVLNMDGTLQGKYDCSETGLVRRVCVVEYGFVLVSGDSNNCILQFSSQGEKLGNVLSSDTENSKCGAVCYDPRRNRLLVGRPGKDEVDIYDLM